MKINQALQTAMLVTCLIVLAWSFVVMIYNSPIAFLGVLVSSAVLLYDAVKRIDGLIQK